MKLSVALTVLFVGLKLGEVITWSWVWVLSPLWISYSVAFSIVGLIALWVYRTEGKENFNRAFKRELDKVNEISK